MTQPAPNLDGLRIAREPKRPSRFGPAAMILVVVAIVAVIAGLWWRTRSRAIDVRTATTQTLADSADRTVLNASGYVTARREATVSSKVTGKVDEILVEEGMKVKEGQVLARIDPTNVRASLALAQAQAAAARAALDETRVRLKEAQQDLQRQSDLRAQNVAAQSDFDHAEAAALALRAHIEEQQAEVGVADRTVGVWQQQLDDTVIRAPFAGTVTSKNAQPGEMISPMSTGGFTRTGICTLVDMQSLEVEIDVNESYINRVEPGQPVEATLDAYPDWKIPCHVIAIIPTADRNKSTVRVRVAFDRLDPRILPDMSVKVAFRAPTDGRAAPPQGVAVPKAAIVSRDGRSVVFLVNAGRAELRAVTVSGGDDDHRIVTAGVSGGDRVILSPPPGLADGTPVREITP